MKEPKPTKQINAAGPWRKAEPSEEGEYLIRYTTPKYPNPVISIGHYLPGTGWLNMFPGMAIMQHARIYNPQPQPKPQP